MMNTSSPKLWLVATLLCIAASALHGDLAEAQDAPKPAIFFTDRGAHKVFSASLDGKDQKVLAKFSSANLRGVAADVPNGKLYFIDNGSDKIYSVNLDGTGLKAIAFVPGFPADLALHRKSKKLYWCDQQNGRIRRCNVDGSEIETVVETKQPYYLDVDEEGDMLYWGTFYVGGRIHRRKLSGGKVETLIAAPAAGIIQIRAVKVDTAKNQIYWVDREAFKIQRGKIEKGKIVAIEDLYTGLDTPHGMVLDLEGKSLYWGDTGTNEEPGSKGSHCVMMGSLDGKAPAKVVYKGSQPWDVDVYRPAKK
jgi:sugar lactone lactonase YvrE